MKDSNQSQDDRLHKQREASKRWYEANKEKALASRKKWREANADRHRDNNRAWDAANKERVRVSAKARYAADPEAQLARNRKHKYGVTAEEVAAMFARQGSRCAACRSDQAGHKWGWHVDHCHTTGRFRGVLCRPCNVGLGNVKDDVARLRALADYLGG